MQGGKFTFVYAHAFGHEMFLHEVRVLGNGRVHITKYHTLRLQPIAQRQRLHHAIHLQHIAACFVRGQLFTQVIRDSRVSARIAIYRRAKIV